jgi:CheY-like chemotaxis protein
MHSILVDKKYLIVDDNRPIRKLFFDVLDHHGVPTANIFGASDVVEALKILEDEKIDVMVLDYNMPYKSGVDLLKEARDKNLLTNVLIIAISGSTNQEVFDQFKEYGAHVFEQKPVSVFDIVKTIITTLKK